jgi:RNAse (barnase) inhibitor barstar
MTPITLSQNTPAINQLSVSQLTQLKQELERQQGTLIELDVPVSHTKADLLAALAQAWQLPSSFGSNFDALYDGLTDQSLLPSGLKAICISGLAQTQISADDYENLFDVLADVAAFWQDHNEQFFVFNVA